MRDCEIKRGKEWVKGCRFHAWGFGSEEGANGDPNIMWSIGIVEGADGTVLEMPPEQIRFTQFDTRQPSADEVERIAAFCHAQWSNWMLYLFSKGTTLRDGGFIIPKDFYDRWWRQANTLYRHLHEPEKNSDRKEARGFFAALRPRG